VSSLGSGAITGTFTAVAPLSHPRVHHTATLLPSGRVLVAGGQTGPQTVTATTEIFDPATGSVTAGPPLNVARMHHAAICLPTGDVLVAGGQSDTAGAAALDTTELFDPVANVWVLGPVLSAARSGPAVASFRDASGLAKVLIAGGAAFQNGLATSLKSADVYLVDSKTTAPLAATLVQDRAFADAVSEPSGGVLVVGGTTLLGAAGGPKAASSEVFDPVMSTFTSCPMNQSREQSGVAAAGAIFAVGGTDGSVPLASVETFDGRAWMAATPLVRARRGLAAAPVRVGAKGSLEVLAIGGLDGSGALASCEFVGPSAGIPASLHVARAFATATPLPNGCVLVAGGTDGSSILSSNEVYSPAGASVPGATSSAGPTAPLGAASGAGSAVNVTALLPLWGSAGTAVTIDGTGFDPNAANDAVTFNGVPALVTSVNVSNPQAESLEVVVPAGATTGPVVVTVNGQASPQAPTFTVGIPGAATPTILIVAPTSGPVFLPVSITGQNFGPTPTVTFNGVPTASIVNMSTKTLPLVGQVCELVVLVPPGASTGPLVVMNSGQSSSPISFTVQ
jgi:hypothetical protein